MIFDIPHIVLYLLTIFLIVAITRYFLDYMCIRNVKSILNNIYKGSDSYSFTEKDLTTFSKNISLVARCVFNNLLLSYNIIQIYNMKENTLKQFITDKNIKCSENQLEIYKFLKKYYSECSKEHVVEYVINYFTIKETVSKPRINEKDFDDLSPVDRQNLRLFVYDQDCVLGNRCLNDKDCSGDFACDSNRYCSCPINTISCNGDCTYVSSDINNCGTCGNTCKPEEICVGGNCTCSQGLISCNGDCTHVSSDNNNCGMCGNTCKPGEICVTGTCVHPITI